MSEEVREDYLESLEELTVNSRPIIKTLTEIAQENVAEAHAVVDALETHTLRCSVNHKLPALYLVDSICKNVGEPYISMLATRIVAIFTNAFGVAPESMRVKLNELFKTWTVPLPGSGEPVFSHDILRQINDFLLRQQMAQMSQIPQIPGPLPGVMDGPHIQARPRLNQTSLMVEINRFRQVLENDNNDQFNKRQLSMLARVEAQISGVVDPKILPEIQNSLDELKLAREQQISRYPPSSNNRRNGGSNHNGNPRRDQRRNGSTKDRDVRRTNGGVGKITGSNNVPIGSRTIRSPKPKDHELAALANSAFEKPEAPPTFDTEMEKLDLTTACEKPASSLLIDQLYSSGLPLQCSTCGYRFQNTSEGRAAKEAEMDWHFRANKDIREGHSRNRCWFLLAVSWVSYRDEDEVFGLGSSLSTGEGVMNSTGTTNVSSTGNGAVSTVELEKERDRYTEVPLDSSVVCPVCQEPHETSWSEEAENWVWMNCVEVEGLYFHATCYADPQNKQLVASVLDQKV